MKRILITIETANDAFDPYPWAEVHRILLGVASRVSMADPDLGPSDGYGWPLRDSNGNTVGAVRFDHDPVDLEGCTVVTLPTEETARRLHVAAVRLFTESRMDADEMRDMAQRLQTILDAIDAGS